MRLRLVHFRLAAILAAVALLTLAVWTLVSFIKTERANGDAKRAANQFLVAVQSRDFERASSGWCSMAHAASARTIQAEFAKETAGLADQVGHAVHNTKMNAPHNDFAVVNFAWTSGRSASRHEVALAKEGGTWRVCGLD